MSDDEDPTAVAMRAVKEQFEQAGFERGVQAERARVRAQIETYIEKSGAWPKKNVLEHLVAWIGDTDAD